MVLTPELLKDLHVVPEEFIVDGANWLTSQGVKGNNLQKLLERAAFFRDQGLDPIYLSNAQGTTFAVTSKETYDIKKLH